MSEPFDADSEPLADGQPVESVDWNEGGDELSIWAIASVVMAVLTIPTIFVFCGFLTALLSVIFGVVALVRHKNGQANDTSRVLSFVGIGLSGLMVVVFVVVTAVFGLVVIEAFVGGAMDEANQNVAHNEAFRLTELVNTHYTVNGELPEDLEQLKHDSDLIDELPEDPWGNDYVYEVQGERDFEVFSAGPDGEPGTGDDIRIDD